MTAKTSSKQLAKRTKPAATRATTLAARRVRPAIVDGGDTRFAEVVALIEAARQRVYQAVNSELIAHYWELGEYISRKIASAEWGDGVVEELATSAFEATRARTSFGCANFTRRTARTEKSHRW